MQKSVLKTALGLGPAVVEGAKIEGGGLGWRRPRGSPRGSSPQAGGARSPRRCCRNGRGGAPRGRSSTSRSTSRRNAAVETPRSAPACSGDARCRSPRHSTATNGARYHGPRASAGTSCCRSPSSTPTRTWCSWATWGPARRTWRRRSARSAASRPGRRASSRPPRS